jgi:hypothetical protein
METFREHPRPATPVLATALIRRASSMGWDGVMSASCAASQSSVVASSTSRRPSHER